MSLVTLLEAKIPLRKKITAQGSRSYPNAKLFTSHMLEYAATNVGLQEKFNAVKDAALKGQCQYRGMFDAPLVEESRAGRTIKDAPASSIMFDLDGMVLPNLTVKSQGNTEFDVRMVAENFISMLPTEFTEATYIAIASSSFGLKGNQVSMHIEFELTTPVPPRMLKLWLLNLNLATPEFQNKVGLTNSKLALSFPIDVTMAENSRIVYVAPPEIDGVTDPFVTVDDRFIFVQKANPTVSISQQIQHLTPDGIEKLKAERKNKLRKAANLPVHKTKFTNLIAQGEQIRVINNPDSMNMEFVRVNEKMGIAYWNINGGDSNAYYCYFHSPNIIHNFKGEDPFEFSKADPERYSWFCEQFAAPIGKANPVEPHVFIDYRTSSVFKFVFDIDNNTFLKPPAPIKDNQVDGFFAEYGKSAPEIIPTWHYGFDPHSEHLLDKANGRVNLYDMPKILRDPVTILPFAQDAKHGEAATKMEMVAPNCYKLIHHLLGADDESFEYFINWLAYCVQERDKSSICWVITGTQGTGKGEFYNKILIPLFGEAFTGKATLEALEDQFNAARETRLFSVVEEFNVKNARNIDGLFSKIKSLVADTRDRIRAMRQEGRDNIRMYDNWMFFSNDVDAMRIPHDDRRCCVCPPQQVKLGEAYPEMNNRTGELIPDEVPRLASFLLSYLVDYNMAKTVLNNSARRAMINASQTWVDTFFSAFNTADLSFFAEALDPMFNDSAAADVVATTAARAIINEWLDDKLNDRASIVTIESLMTVYNARAEKRMHQDKFKSMIAKMPMPERKRRTVGKGIRKLAWERNWIVSDENLQDLAQYSTSDKVAGLNAAKTPASFTVDVPVGGDKEDQV